ncbi:uncharacterized protein E0L32_004714 [Thyridium curvatum]|uniref:Enhancer of polycomb-like protein n=1 Tax=Thyridium curvatum TaxID=1093900 RepID=A0A507B7P5_9PEZI|nr:uncharacterized protein E0L32_004714 [Thyridium curvatum]TPX15156.1 hypothetical protein E0L32_004714 [Thyridium curvatum]
MATRKVRYKKLNIKTPLQVLREDQVDPTEYESLSTETQIATGVEQAEENEYHLQVVLRNAGVSADKEIPVPPPQETQNFNYDELYPSNFRQPTNYIRFSQTVEECISCQYDMTEADDEFLKAYNSKRPAASQLSEDDFEFIMEVFEDTAAVQAPFAAVDNTVVPYDMMVQGLTQLDTAKIMPHAKEIYEHWKTQRQVMGNRSLHPTLKFETHQDSDEMDPYVCFRRREVRQTRKTRARDVQSADKLKRLRRELEDGRQLIMLSHEREMLKRELLNTDRLVYEHRARLKEAKVRLGIKAHDEDLINQKVSKKADTNGPRQMLTRFSLQPQKRKAPEAPVVQRPPGTQLRMPPRSDGRAAEADLTLLATKLAEKENEMLMDIKTKSENHHRWNQNHVDLTRDPLGPVPGRKVESYRPAKVQYLMTPPTSASSAEGLDEPTAMDLDDPAHPAPVFQFRGVASKDQDAAPVQRGFRRRIGRLNRLWIDRKGLASPPGESQGREYSDQWKYDDEDSDEEQPVYNVDPFDLRALKFRATIPLFPSVARKPQAEGAASGGAGARPALPPAQQQQQQQQQSQPQAQPSAS